MRKRTSFLIILTVLGLLIYILKDIEFSKIWQIIRQANPLYFGLAFASTFFAFLIWTFRWWINIRKVAPVKFWSLFVFLLAGLFFNLITPGRSVGGEFIWAYFLNKKYDKSKTCFIGTIVADKFSYIVSLFIVALFSTIYILTYFNLPYGSRILFTILLVLLLFALFLVILMSVFKKKISFVPLISFIYRYFIRFFYKISIMRRKYLSNKATEFGETFYSLVHHNGLFYISIVLSFLYWGFCFLTSYFLFMGFGLDIRFLYVVVVLGIGYFFGDISIIPGGIGFTEGSMYLLYANVNVPKEIAALVVIANSAITYFFSLILGSICALYLKLKYD